MILYSLPLSPFASRVRLAIYRKGLDVAIVPPPEGGMQGDAFRKINPMGQIPTLVTDRGTAIPESAAILEYLEDMFPSPSLRPADPEQLARARLFLRIPDVQFQGAPRVLVSMRDPAKRDQAKVDANFAILEKVLASLDHFVSGGPWAVGDKPSIADCAIVPILNVLRLIGKAYDRPDLIGKHRKLDAYWQAAQSDPVNARVVAEMTEAVAKLAPA